MIIRIYTAGRYIISPPRMPPMFRCGTESTSERGYTEPATHTRQLYILYWHRKYHTPAECSWNSPNTAYEYFQTWCHVSHDDYYCEQIWFICLCASGLPQWHRGSPQPIMTSWNGNIFRVTGPLCGEFIGPGEFPAQRPVTRSFDVFFDLRPNKRLSKQPWDWWFETPSWLL